MNERRCIAGGDKRRCEGFTLVELSIVLVVIGLLIGGVLAAQSLIENARAYRYIKELQAIKIGYDSFVSTIKQKPGDFSSRIEMMGGTTNGNGNGVIQWNNSESGEFWFDLQRLGYKDIADNFRVTAYYMDRNKKASSHNGSDFYYAFTGDLYGPYNESAISGEDTITLGNIPVGGSTVSGIAIKAGALAGIDRKMDDGLPYTGKVRGHLGVELFSPYPTTICSQMAAGVRQYKVDEAEDNCRLLFILEGN